MFFTTSEDIMKKHTAINLVEALKSDLGECDSFHLTKEIQKLPLQDFHSFADGRRCLGAFRVAKVSGENLWLLVIDWREDDNYYVVIYPDQKNLPPIAEQHNKHE